MRLYLINTSYLSHTGRRFQVSIAAAHGLFMRLRSVADIERDHSVDRSRSSETMRVLSVPPRSLPFFISFRKAGVI